MAVRGPRAAGTAPSAPVLRPAAVTPTRAPGAVLQGQKVRFSSLTVLHPKEAPLRGKIDPFSSRFPVCFLTALLEPGGSPAGRVRRLLADTVRGFLRRPLSPPLAPPLREAHVYVHLLALPDFKLSGVAPREPPGGPRFLGAARCTGATREASHRAVPPLRTASAHSQRGRLEKAPAWTSRQCHWEEARRQPGGGALYATAPHRTKWHRGCCPHRPQRPLHTVSDMPRPLPGYRLRGHCARVGSSSALSLCVPLTSFVPWNVMGKLRDVLGSVPTNAVLTRGTRGQKTIPHVTSSQTAVGSLARPLLKTVCEGRGRGRQHEANDNVGGGCEAGATPTLGTPRKVSPTTPFHTFQRTWICFLNGTD